MFVICPSLALAPSSLSVALISNMSHSPLTLTILVFCPNHMTWGEADTHTYTNTHTRMFSCTLKQASTLCYGTMLSHSGPPLICCHSLLMHSLLCGYTNRFSLFLSLSLTHTDTLNHNVKISQTEQNKWSVSCCLAQPIVRSHEHCRLSLYSVSRVTLSHCTGEGAQSFHGFIFNQIRGEREKKPGLCLSLLVQQAEIGKSATSSRSRSALSCHTRANTEELQHTACAGVCEWGQALGQV